LGHGSSGGVLDWQAQVQIPYCHKKRKYKGSILTLPKKKEGRREERGLVLNV
jgi:hypothetical protein